MGGNKHLQFISRWKEKKGNSPSFTSDGWSNDGIRCREMDMKVILHIKKAFITLARGPVGRSGCVPLPSVAPRRFRSTVSEQAQKG